MKKVSSVVWQFFERVEENKRCVAVVCSLCENEYKYFGNTTNLRAHLLNKHPIQWELRKGDGQKTLEESSIRVIDDDESTNQSVSPKRRKYTRKNKNVRYALSIKKPGTGITAGEDSMPKIEIQRVDVLENKDDDNEEHEATQNLVRQMHNQASDEEWLDEDYQTLTEIYEPNQRKVYRKVKREVITPPKQLAPKYIIHGEAKKKRLEPITLKDEFSVFGEYIANRLRKFKAPRTRGNIQQLITTILWQAEYGMYDDADSVKRILMYNVATDEGETEQNVHEHLASEMEVQSEDVTNKIEINQSDVQENQLDD